MREVFAACFDTIKDVPVIPAHRTYYWSDDISLKGRAAKVIVTPEVGESQAAQAKLPTIANLRLATDSLGDLEVQGLVHNTLLFRLFEIATVNVALFYGNDDIVGGGSGPSTPMFVREAVRSPRPKSN